MGLKLKFLPK